MDDSTVDDAIEEMLRYLSVGHGTLPRVVRKDVVLSDTRISAGSVVLCSLPAANRDPDVVVRPDVLDMTRKQNPHLAFGHGARRCFGAPLARVEMVSAYQGLFRRFPALRLAVPMDDVEFQTATTAYGVVSLPVSW
ncbi:hypothetical protein GCM10029964_055560 [Kibdelosporangium lantanae]